VTLEQTTDFVFLQVFTVFTVFTTESCVLSLNTSQIKPSSAISISISISLTMQVPLIRLQCGVNSYDWGKVGKDSAAAKFAAATPADGFSIKEDKPYAEVH